MRIREVAIPGVLALVLAAPSWMLAASPTAQVQAAQQPAAGQPAAEEQSNTPAGQEIIRHERALWDAIKSKNQTTLNEMIGPTAMFVTPNGVENKWQFLQTLQGLNLQNATPSNFQVRMPGADSRVVVYQVQQYGTLGGQQLSRSAWVTSVWYQKDGKWILVSRQMTPVG